MIDHFANEVEKLAYRVKGGRGAPRKGKGTPAGVTQPKKEPGAPFVPSVGVKIPKFNQNMKRAIRTQSKKLTPGKMGKWG